LKTLRGDLDAVKHDSNLERTVTILQRIPVKDFSIASGQGVPCL
jgi:hypothetical protein